MAKTNKNADEVVSVFTKEQFLKSKTYGKHRDLLTVLLNDNKTYSKEQVDNMIRKAGN